MTKQSFLCVSLVKIAAQCRYCTICKMLRLASSIIAAIILTMIALLYVCTKIRSALFCCNKTFTNLSTNSLRLVKQMLRMQKERDHHSRYNWQHSIIRDTVLKDRRVKLSSNYWCVCLWNHWQKTIKFIWNASQNNSTICIGKRV